MIILGNTSVYLISNLSFPPYRMISLIVAKLETNFLQQNYLGQSLAEADILCKKFHFEHFKKVPTYPLHQVLGMVQPLFGQKQHTSQTT